MNIAVSVSKISIVLLIIYIYIYQSTYTCQSISMTLTCLRGILSEDNLNAHALTLAVLPGPPVHCGTDLEALQELLRLCQ